MANRGLSREQLVKNVRAMRVPTPLLKFGASGKPKFRTFHLSEKGDFLRWESKNKTFEESQIKMTDVKEVMFGQRTSKFVRNNRPDLANLSFSILYAANEKDKRSAASVQASGIDSNGCDSLDLVCKDEQEYQIWAYTFVEFAKGRIDDSIVSEADALIASSDYFSKDHHLDTGDYQDTYDMYTFGWGEWGQTAQGSDSNATVAPKIVESLLGKGVVAVASGWSHTTILLESGAVLQCGNRLATGLDKDYFVPTPTAITEKLNVNTIACGAFHTVAVTERGEILSWGCNFHGQLGHGHNKDVPLPSVVAALRDVEISTVACGDHATAAVSLEGALYTWGSGAHGFLGHSNEEDRYTPTLVNDLAGCVVKKICAGSAFMIACAENPQAETYSWGWNACGQLGLGHTQDTYRPHPIDALRGQRVSSVACGAAHVAAVVEHKKMGVVLYAWGSNSKAQLGDSKKNMILRPQEVPLTHLANDVGDPVEVACGAMHTIFRSSNGNTYTCGSNNFGQLGLGINQDFVGEFTFVSGLKDKEVRSVLCGGQHTCALTARVWVKDEEVKDCMNCKVVFSTFTRKHHCRNCFGIFCGNCSNKRIALLKNKSTEPERVCDTCFKKLTTVVSKN